jgi:hypothetical protein
MRYIHAMVSTPLLDPQQASFIQGSVSIHVSSRSDALVPSVTRAVGCRVSADRRRVTLFVGRAQSPALVADIEASGILAAAFTEPGSHRTLQLKAANAILEPPDDADRDRVARYCECFVDSLLPLGFCAGAIRGVMSFDAGDLVAIAFEPSAAFDQTPGPAAGAALGRTR